jgi:HrpA-like RNA helicase
MFVKECAVVSRALPKAVATPEESLARTTPQSGSGKKAEGREASGSTPASTARAERGNFVPSVMQRERYGNINANSSTTTNAHANTPNSRDKQQQRDGKGAQDRLVHTAALPADEFRDQILDKIRSDRVTVIHGETGYIS